MQTAHEHMSNCTQIIWCHFHVRVQHPHTAKCVTAFDCCTVNCTVLFSLDFLGLKKRKHSCQKDQRKKPAGHFALLWDKIQTMKAGFTFSIIFSLSHLKYQEKHKPDQWIVWKTSHFLFMVSKSNHICIHEGNSLCSGIYFLLISHLMIALALGAWIDLLNGL